MTVEIKETDVGLADDILDGADEIALFLWGDAKKKRRVYHLAECGLLPVFRLGQLVQARKSTLVAHIENEERRVVASRQKEAAA